MRAYRIAAEGAAPAFADIPTPAPGEGEVLVRIAAAALNFADLLMIEGRYQATPPPPFTLGLEAAGTVEACGPGVAHLPPGTRVAVFAGHGTLAEAGCFAARRCLPLPDAMDDDVAAAFPVAYGTAHLALSHRARLAPGETLAVLGAAGGAGLAAVEVGAALGARVIAVARGHDRLRAARAAGAHHTLDTDTLPAPDSLREALRALGGANVVYDTLGGDAFAAAFRATRPEGRILAIGFASGAVPPVALNIAMVKNISVLGVNWPGYDSFRPEALHASLRAALGWWQAGRLAPHIGHRLPFARTPEALDLLRRRAATGKVVVTMPQG